VVVGYIRSTHIDCRIVSRLPAAALPSRIALTPIQVDLTDGKGTDDEKREGET